MAFLFGVPKAIGGVLKGIITGRVEDAPAYIAKAVAKTTAEETAHIGWINAGAGTGRTVAGGLIAGGVAKEMLTEEEKPWYERLANNAKKIFTPQRNQGAGGGPGNPGDGLTLSGTDALVVGGIAGLLTALGGGIATLFGAEIGMGTIALATLGIGSVAAAGGAFMGGKATEYVKKLTTPEVAQPTTTKSKTEETATAQDAPALEEHTSIEIPKTPVNQAMVDAQKKMGASANVV